MAKNSENSANKTTNATNTQSTNGTNSATSKNKAQNKAGNKAQNKSTNSANDANNCYQSICTKQQNQNSIKVRTDYKGIFVICFFKRGGRQVEYGDIRTIGVKDIPSYRRRADVEFIDVREKEDYDLYHIEGARNLPYDDMEIWEKRLNKEKMYVLYCERGSMSMMAAKHLQRMGYSVCTLVGGIRAIQEKNLD